jgi:hypothetical protein
VLREPRITDNIKLPTGDVIDVGKPNRDLLAVDVTVYISRPFRFSASLVVRISPLSDCVARNQVLKKRDIAGNVLFTRRVERLRLC